MGIVLKGLLLTEKLKGKGCGSRPLQNLNMKEIGKNLRYNDT